MKNSAARYRNGTAERSRPTSSATSRRAVVSSTSAKGRVTSTWPPTIPILFCASATRGALNASSARSPRWIRTQTVTAYTALSTNRSRLPSNDLDHDEQQQPDNGESRAVALQYNWYSGGEQIQLALTTVARRRAEAGGFRGWRSRRRCSGRYPCLNVGKR